MVRSRDVVQAEGSARTEGARRATGVRADGAAAGAGSLAPGQRWSASRKRDVVLRLLRGESLEALSRETGVEIYRRRSGGIVRSRSKRSTAESFRTSRPSAPPWPTSWSGTTRPGVSRSLGIKRRSRRARSMSYARRHSTNVCPGNRVRYKPGKSAATRRIRTGSQGQKQRPYATIRIGSKRLPAATYSPTELPPQYHRRKRA